MGEVLAFPEAGDCPVLKIDFQPLFTELSAIVAIAETGQDLADRLTGFLQLAATGVERVGFLRVEVVPGGFRLSAHATEAFCTIFETPGDAA